MEPGKSEVGSEDTLRGESSWAGHLPTRQVTERAGSIHQIPVSGVAEQAVPDLAAGDDLWALPIARLAALRALCWRYLYR